MSLNKKKIIIQLDFNLNQIATYNSIDEAARKLGTSRTIISKCVSGKSSQSKGYYFVSQDMLERFIREKSNSSQYTCKICNLQLNNNRSLATHIQITHGIETRDYTIKYLYNSIVPVCKHENCNNEPRYVGFSFHEYCKEHAEVAMSIGGKIGASITNKDGAWNKGLTKETDERIKKQAENMLGEKNHFFGKKHNSETKQNLKDINTLTEQEFIKRIETRKDEFDLKSLYFEYINQNKKLVFICKKCNKENLLSLFNFYSRKSLCANCFPSGKSKDELELYNFIKDFLITNKNYSCDDIINGDRQTIKPKELDILIKSKNFAIEYNGLYWHGEHEHLGRVEKRTIQEKSDLCKSLGIQLFHIFSDEWINNKDLIKSMILSKLGYSQNKLYARKLKIKELTNAEAKMFFDSSHLSGHVRSEKIFALVDGNNEVLCALSLRKPHHKKYDSYVEIARFATKPNHQIVGGFSKLLNHSIVWIKQNNYKKILSYCDLRHGTGRVYEASGFVYKGDSDISYWYTDGKQRYNRFKFRADSKNGKTEEDVAKENNVWKIYGCKNKIYEYVIK